MPIASSLLNKPRLVEKLRDFYNYVQKNDGKVGKKTISKKTKQVKEPAPVAESAQV